MKLYTRSGDDGTTGLFGGDRVNKDHPRIEACGNVDELNAMIGLVVALLGAHPHPKNFPAVLTTIQSRLLDLGADLATPLDSKHESKIKRIHGAHVETAERWIDEIDSANSALTTFILPGGTELAAQLHVTRAVCRRAERAMVRLAHAEPINPHALRFVNRLSDLLFAMARLANKQAGVPDVEWRQ